MKGKWAKFLSALVCLTLAVGFVSCGGNDDGGGDGGGDGSLVYEISEDGTYATVTGYEGTATQVVIASVYEGVPVTGIAWGAFESCSSLTEIVIPDSVTCIRELAFHDCGNLTSVTFGENSELTSIGNSAFYYCSSLAEIVIPDGVTSIGDAAFANCSSLTEIVIPDSVTLIHSNAFYECSGLTEIIIPANVTSIGRSVFYGCTGLAKITFKDTSTWYRTTSSEDRQNETGGTETDVTDPSANATYFKSTYKNYYWYKL